MADEDATRGLYEMCRILGVRARENDSSRAREADAQQKRGEFPHAFVGRADLGAGRTGVVQGKMPAVFQPQAFQGTWYGPAAIPYSGPACRVPGMYPMHFNRLSSATFGMSKQSAQKLFQGQPVRREGGEGGFIGRGAPDNGVCGDNQRAGMVRGGGNRGRGAGSARGERFSGRGRGGSVRPGRGRGGSGASRHMGPGGSYGGVAKPGWRERLGIAPDDPAEVYQPLELQGPPGRRRYNRPARTSRHYYSAADRGRNNARRYAQKQNRRAAYRAAVGDLAAEKARVEDLRRRLAVAEAAAGNAAGNEGGNDAGGSGGVAAPPVAQPTGGRDVASSWGGAVADAEVAALPSEAAATVTDLAPTRLAAAFDEAADEDAGDAVVDEPPSVVVGTQNAGRVAEVEEATGVQEDNTEHEGSGDGEVVAPVVDEPQSVLRSGRVRRA